MPLHISSTKEASSPRATVLLYGDNGSGKTTFASTWPNPVFLVPWISRGEMKSLSDDDFPVIYFDSLKEQTKLLCRAVLTGEMRCNTIVVDNLTAIQMALEEEIKRTGNRDKMNWDDWGKFLSVFQNLLASLHKLPPHVIWITHQKIVKIDEDRSTGGYTLAGKSKELIPNFVDMILHTVASDLHAAGTKYRLHLRGHEIWTCRVRSPRGRSVQYPAFIEDPSYDALATLMGWPSCVEVESTPAPEVTAAEIAAIETATESEPQR